MSSHRAEQVLRFWFGQDPKRWFEKNVAFDAEIRDLFLPLYEELSSNADWLSEPRECLAIGQENRVVIKPEPGAPSDRARSRVLHEVDEGAIVAACRE